ncbi:SEP domain-containing protein [Spironucleus salmonicida]|uniref:UBX domain-containing protein 11 n=1 Tax=Spironucleus salmonicida TaxID=348837 RepID=V6M095_9EUKA|nr:SEP domain-containing protein [Spironucleus salmonicida]|eukprot:EST49461.1 SEP domain-containing protein [Spironucleus salmonicida]
MDYFTKHPDKNHKSNAYISTLDGGTGIAPPPQLLSNDINPVQQLAQKLKFQEQENENLRILLQRANGQIVSLTGQLEQIRVQGISDFQFGVEIQQLKSYAKTLENQIFSMENFLDQNGMVFLEDEVENQIESGIEEFDAKSFIEHEIAGITREQQSFQVDFELLEANIRKLNFITQKKEFVDTDGVVQFRDSEGIPVIFYKDGIYIKRGPFRSFQLESAREFVKDISDGFVPSELRDQYPDGVNIIAKYETCEFLAKKDPGFSGAAKNIDGEQVWKPDMDELEQIRKNYKIAPQYKDSNIKDFKDNNNMLEPMSLNVLLSKIQDNKVVNGRVIDIKSQFQQEKQSLDKTVVISRPVESGQNATLRIKLNSGQNIIMKLSFESDVSEIYENLANIMQRDKHSLVVLRALGGEVQSYGQTLLEAGLTPNCRLFVKESK